MILIRRFRFQKSSEFPVLATVVAVDRIGTDPVVVIVAIVAEIVVLVVDVDESVDGAYRRMGGRSNWERTSCSNCCPQSMNEKARDDVLPRVVVVAVVVTMCRARQTPAHSARGLPSEATEPKRPGTLPRSIR